MTSFSAAPVITHPDLVYGLRGPALAAFMGLLGAHFVSHDALDRECLVRLAAEAEAIA